MIWWVKLSDIELSIIFPAYNEEENIVETIEKALPFLERYQAEIIVVDDGSTDCTVQMLEPYKHSISLVQHRENRGYGCALRSGFSHAKGVWIFFCDADLQFPFDALHEFWNYTDTYDLIVGYRAPRQDAVMRIVNAGLWRLLVNQSLGLSIRDINCAFKLIRTSRLRSIVLHAQGASINAELFAKLCTCPTIQLPVCHLPRRRGKQSGAHPRVIIRALWELAALVADVRFGIEVQKPSR